MPKLKDQPLNGGATQPVFIMNGTEGDDSGGAGTPVVLAAGNNNIGDVDVVSLPSLVAGEAHIGEIGGRFTTVSVEFTRENNATPYGIGDVISGSAATPLVYELPNIMRIAGGSGYVVNVRVVFNVKSVIPTLRLSFYNASNPTVSGDNLPSQEKYADLSKSLGWVDIDAMTTPADTANSDISKTTARAKDLFPVKAAAGSRSLWVSLQTLLAVTLTAQSKVTIIVTVDNN